MKYSILLLFVLAAISGCKSSTSPNSNSSNQGSGTLLFAAPNPEVSTMQIGSGVANGLFTGNDPSYAPGGKIVYYEVETTTADGQQHIYVSNMDGTGAQSVVSFGQNITTGYIHPKMSPDGKYVSFNYWEDAGETSLGSTYGTLIYTSAGAPYRIAQDVWDGDWAPDGSLVVSGTMTDFDGQYTWLAPGLFHYSKDFSSVVPIGSGLTTPRYPAVSPDGTKVAFTMNSHLWVINMDGTGLKQITTGNGEQTYACWSPDGNYIACQSTGDGGIISDEGMIIVPSDPATPSTISSTTNYWILDKNSGNIPFAAIGNIGWK